MNNKLKKRWVTALRSGKYRQGRESLITRTGALCCLGVLCEVQEPKITGGWHMLTIPRPELWAGLDSDDIDVLVTANDIARWTFEHIATYIEEML